VDRGSSIDEFKVVLAGRVTRIKNVRAFIRIIAYIVQVAGTSVNGVVLGDWNRKEGYYEQCRELTRQYRVEDYVEFKGYRNLNSEFVNTHALLITSYSEGLPYVVLDAFANGVPVVAYNVGACREMVSCVDDPLSADNIFPPGSIVDIANYLIALRDDPHMYTRLVEQGRSRLGELFQNNAFREYELFMDTPN